MKLKIESPLDFVIDFLQTKPANIYTNNCVNIMLGKNQIRETGDFKFDDCVPFDSLTGIIKNVKKVFQIPLPQVSWYREYIISQNILLRVDTTTNVKNLYFIECVSGNSALFSGDLFDLKIHNATLVKELPLALLEPQKHYETVNDCTEHTWDSPDIKVTLCEIICLESATTFQSNPSDAAVSRRTITITLKTMPSAEKLSKLLPCDSGYWKPIGDLKRASL